MILRLWGYFYNSFNISISLFIIFALVLYIKAQVKSKTLYLYKKTVRQKPHRKFIYKGNQFKIASSVAGSNKCTRAGLKATLIVIPGFAVDVGATRAVILLPL